MTSAAAATQGGDGSGHRLCSMTSSTGGCDGPGLRLQQDGERGGGHETDVIKGRAYYRVIVAVHRGQEKKLFIKVV
ncbi:hypothetical protein PR003_g2751 [Phytophthora rubi]|uniref:Uncharacterized protein n=1 Tax=Phytophthora rubi TaxID=129364 RepID=A0A6A4G7C5_9STRA|nr:hypothetical protein PR003_g2751 [Phytophthora rubi]